MFRNCRCRESPWQLNFQNSQNLHRSNDAMPRRLQDVVVAEHSVPQWTTVYFSVDHDNCDDVDWTGCAVHAKGAAGQSRGATNNLWAFAKSHGNHSAKNPTRSVQYIPVEILPRTRWWDRPEKKKKSTSPEHENGGFVFFAARPPYRLFLGLWMELNGDCSIHLILHRRALPSVIQYWRCDALPLS